MLPGMKRLEEPTRQRGWQGFFQVPPKPLHNLYFAMFMVVVSIVLPLVDGGPGVAFAGGALGVLFVVAGQLRAQEPDER